MGIWWARWASNPRCIFVAGFESAPSLQLRHLPIWCSQPESNRRFCCERAVLYHLSYNAMYGSSSDPCCGFVYGFPQGRPFWVVRATRFERAQSASQMLGSTIKLHPDIGAFRPHTNRGFTGATVLHRRQTFTAVRSRRSEKGMFWWAFTVSNCGPIGYEPMALAN